MTTSARAVALLATLATFLVSLVAFGKFDASVAGFQLVEQAEWVPSIGLGYLLGVDGVSIWLVLLTTFLFPIAVLASWPVTRDVRLYMISMLALETAVRRARSSPWIFCCSSSSSRRSSCRCTS